MNQSRSRLKKGRTRSGTLSQSAHYCEMKLTLGLESEEILLQIKTELINNLIKNLLTVLLTSQKSQS